jgi:hypothetical protein
VFNVLNPNIDSLGQNLVSGIKQNHIHNVNHEYKYLPSL